MKEELKAGVGLSRKWDAREAGREVAETALEKLDGEKPKFFLLFSTIHYEKYGGFQELLNGVWEVLPEGTPLIGGTVAGFMNNYGCFARGVTALTVSYPNMDVAVGVGENTRKNPKKAAEKCATSITKKLSNSKFDKKLLLDVMPGPTRPSFVGVGSHWVISNPIIARSAPELLSLSVKRFQLGQGLEDEIIKHLSSNLKDYVIFGLSSSDDNKLETNFQFVENGIHRFSLAGMGISTDLKFDFAHSDGLRPTGIRFLVTGKTQGGRIIKTLNGKPASHMLFEKLKIPVELLDDRILRITFFYPLGFRAPDGRACPDAIGCVLRDYLALNYSVESDEIEVFTASGETLIRAVHDAINSLSIDKPHLGFIVSCLARLEALGKNVFEVKDILENYFAGAPYLLLYTGGENTKFPGELPHHYNETFNILVV